MSYYTPYMLFVDFTIYSIGTKSKPLKIMLSIFMWDFVGELKCI